MADPAPVSAIVLAGGRGRRVGNRDKGLIEVDGKRLIEHVVTRLRHQVAEFIISCNRNVDIYASYGRTVRDRQPGYPGPLMGILSAAEVARHDLCLVTPCDMPSLPTDLVSRFLTAISDHDAAIAHDCDRLQPLVVLLGKPVIAGISQYLKDGNSSVKGWLSDLNCIEVDFSDQADAFINLNTQD
ncbi:MAG: molybdenum cofactor guanylyltransferase [Pseudomonadales bacterium]|nr:molybdenum cofactor guanylyltransferase [Pseudomonadales bacterium]